MRILVIDDNLLHQMSARQTLGGHNVTIVGTYDEAHELLQEPRASYEAVDAELKRRGFKNFYSPDATEEEKIASRAERKLIEQELCPSPSFDVVLSDLLMPASEMTMGQDGMKYVGQEMPVGFALSLMASLYGAKYVAVVTDANHHDHPASAMLDSFDSDNRVESGKPPRFVINGAKVGYYHSPMTLVEGTVCAVCNGTGSKEVCRCVKNNDGSPRLDCDDCNGTGRHSCWTCSCSGKQWGKDWGRVIAHLTTQPA